MDGSPPIGAGWRLPGGVVTRSPEIGLAGGFSRSRPGLDDRAKAAIRAGFKNALPCTDPMGERFTYAGKFALDLARPQADLRLAWGRRPCAAVGGSAPEAVVGARHRQGSACRQSGQPSPDRYPTYCYDDMK